MSKRITTFAAALLALCFAAGAQGRRPASAPDAPKDNDKKEEAVELSVKAGLLGVAQHENDWYFELPDSLLGRRMLAVTRFVSNTAGAGTYGGEEVAEAMIYWEKAANGNLLLRADVVNIQADEDQVISKAVKVSSENPIVASFKPEKNAPAGSTRIKVNSLFEGHTQIF